MPYFIISNSDGETTVDQIDKDTLIERIQPEEGEECNYYGRAGFLNKIEDSDTNYWGDNILIIKGEIISPKPKTVIETYEVD